MLTGVCEKHFEKWCKEQDYFQKQFLEIHLIVSGLLVLFRWLPFGMKFSSYIDFFDTKELYIEIFKDQMTTGEVFFSAMVNYEEIDFNYPTRNEARIEAIKQANILYNEKK